jgi:hypothetical protein
MFQLGVVSEAVQQVISAGVVYVAAAGDSGSHGYQAPWVTTPGNVHLPDEFGCVADSDQSRELRRQSVFAD